MAVTLNKTPETPADPAPIKTLQSFSQRMGISAVTAWRYRKAGWLETVNIAGRPYVTAEGEAKFISRAVAGEFAKDRPSPKKAA